MSPPTDRLMSAARDRGKCLVAAGANRLSSALRGRTKRLFYASTALAVAGVATTMAAGTATAATAHAYASRAQARHARAGHALAGAGATSASVAALPSMAALMSAGHALRLTPALPPGAASTSASVAALPSIAALTSAGHALPLTPVKLPVQPGAATQAPSEPPVVTWAQVQDAISAQTNPVAPQNGPLPAADRLTPLGISGPQTWMPISPAQLSNATAIVQQALDKKMGIRAAVIAVATAMQESRLLNLHYGDMDSLGLFQQRPSMGWGTAAQITSPSFAAGAFLTALQQHQAGDPGWAMQPLWASAQAVQKSGFPFAYGRWESQAAGLVKQIAMQLR